MATNQSMFVVALVDSTKVNKSDFLGKAFDDAACFTRCRHAMARCAEQEPPFRDQGDGHWAACFLHEK